MLSTGSHTANIIKLGRVCAYAVNAKIMLQGWEGLFTEALCPFRTDTLETDQKSGIATF